MRGWTELEGNAVALPQENVDTDQLLPARFMSVPRSEGYGEYLLHDQRRIPGGSALNDHVLNRHPDARVLVARRNFGCGSSREAAVYALVDAGIRAVIAPSFGDIFAANAVNNGLLPGVIDAGQAETLISVLGDGAKLARISLNDMMLRVEGHSVSFALNDVSRMKLINGWDDIDLTHAEGATIASYRERRKREASWSWPSHRR